MVRKRFPGSLREEYENLSGIRFLDLTEEQQKMLEQIVLLFAEKYRSEIVEQIQNRKKIFDPSTLRFSYVFFPWICRLLLFHHQRISHRV